MTNPTPTPPSADTGADTDVELVAALLHRAQSHIRRLRAALETGATTAELALADEHADRQHIAERLIGLVEQVAAELRTTEGPS